MVTFIIADLDGKKIGYSSETMFYVEVGKGAKGSYKPRYSFKGQLGRAVSHFNAINIGRGYKKRLRMEEKTLARMAS